MEQEISHRMYITFFLISLLLNLCILLFFAHQNLRFYSIAKLFAPRTDAQKNLLAQQNDATPIELISMQGSPNKSPTLPEKLDQPILQPQQNPSIVKPEIPAESLNEPKPIEQPEKERINLKNFSLAPSGPAQPDSSPIADETNIESSDSATDTEKMPEKTEEMQKKAHEEKQADLMQQAAAQPSPDQPDLTHSAEAQTNTNTLEPLLNADAAEKQTNTESTDKQASTETTDDKQTQTQLVETQPDPRSLEAQTNIKSPPPHTVAPLSPALQQQKELSRTFFNNAQTQSNDAQSNDTHQKNILSKAIASHTTAANQTDANAQKKKPLTLKEITLGFLDKIENKQYAHNNNNKSAKTASPTTGYQSFSLSAINIQGKGAGPTLSLSKQIEFTNYLEKMLKCLKNSFLTNKHRIYSPRRNMPAVDIYAAFDQNGLFTDVRVILSSGFSTYDTLAIEIFQDANSSMPKLPKGIALPPGYAYRDVLNLFQVPLEHITLTQH